MVLETGYLRQLVDATSGFVDGHSPEIVKNRIYPVAGPVLRKFDPLVSSVDQAVDQGVEKCASKITSLRETVSHTMNNVTKDSFKDSFLARLKGAYAVAVERVPLSEQTIARLSWPLQAFFDTACEVYATMKTADGGVVGFAEFKANLKKKLGPAWSNLLEQPARHFWRVASHEDLQGLDQGVSRVAVLRKWIESLAESALSTTEGVVERYLPAEEDEKDEDKPVTLRSRAVHLPMNAARRLRKSAVVTMQGARVRTDNLIHVDLIAYAAGKREALQSFASLQTKRVEDAAVKVNDLWEKSVEQLPSRYVDEERRQVLKLLLRTYYTRVNESAKPVILSAYETANGRIVTLYSRAKENGTCTWVLVNEKANAAWTKAQEAKTQVCASSQCTWVKVKESSQCYWIKVKETSQGSWVKVKAYFPADLTEAAFVTAFLDRLQQIRSLLAASKFGSFVEKQEDDRVSEVDDEGFQSPTDADEPRGKMVRTKTTIVAQ